MKKKLITLILAVVMLFSTVGAVDTYTAEEKTADALNHLGLFLGKSSGDYALSANLNRNQGAILLVRMLGMEEEAKTGGYTCSFIDLPGGAAAHVAFAYTHGIINGYDANYFGGADIMTDKMFLALTLRALGYSDKDGRDFSYHQSRQMAYSIGLLDDADADSNFTRGEAVQVFWRALQATLNGENKTLVQRLIQQGVFTSQEYAEACEIQANGRDKYQGVPAVPEEDEPEPTPEPTPDPEPEVPGGTEEPADDGKMTYEKYIGLNGFEQQAFMETFDSIPAFFEWYNTAKAEYEANREIIEIGGDGTIDLGDIINRQN